MIVEPSALQAHQISAPVPPSKQTREAMIRDHVRSLRAVIKLCIDRTGLVTDSALIKRTGYTEYDSKLVAALPEWQYRPFLINGTPTAVCSTLEYLYSPR